MAIIKHISIKKSPLDLLEYITGESKENRAAFVTGINCSTDANAAYQEMGLIYESFTGQKYCDKQKGEGKQKIKMHHYIQSFSGKEVTPEEAHRLAQEWAKSVFGNDYQIVIATHTDSGNIHNHIAVNSYSLSGEHWIDNKKTLQLCRDVSDRILKEQGLSVIEKPQKRRNYSYKENEERNKNSSWKEKLCRDIDEVVMLEEVKNLNDFVIALCFRGYEVRQGKYLSVKPSHQENCRSVRTFRLGDGYSKEEIEYRIKYKDSIISNDKILTYRGAAQDCALCLQIMQKRKREPRLSNTEITYREILKTCELLSYMSRNSIHSKERMVNFTERKVSKCDKIINEYEGYEQIIRECKYLMRRGKRYLNIRNGNSADEIAEYDKIDALAKKYNFNSMEDMKHLDTEIVKNGFLIRGLQEDYIKALAEKKEVQGYYKHYLSCIETDYDKALKEARAEIEKVKQEKAAKEATEREKAHQKYLIEEYKFLHGGREPPKYVPKKQEVQQRSYYQQEDR